MDHTSELSVARQGTPRPACWLVPAQPSATDLELAPPGHVTDGNQEMGIR